MSVSLPLEIYQYIFEFACYNDPITTGNCSLVCSIWKKAIDSHSPIWKNHVENLRKTVSYPLDGQELDRTKVTQFFKRRAALLPPGTTWDVVKKDATALLVRLFQENQSITAARLMAYHPNYDQQAVIASLFGRSFVQPVAIGLVAKRKLELKIEFFNQAGFDEFRNGNTLGFSPKKLTELLVNSLLIIKGLKISDLVASKVIQHSTDIHIDLLKYLFVNFKGITLPTLGDYRAEIEELVPSADEISDHIVMQVKDGFDLIDLNTPRKEKTLRIYFEGVMESLKKAYPNDELKPLIEILEKKLELNSSGVS